VLAVGDEPAGDRAEGAGAFRLRQRRGLPLGLAGVDVAGELLEDGGGGEAGFGEAELRPAAQRRLADLAVEVVAARPSLRSARLDEQIQTPAAVVLQLLPFGSRLHRFNRLRRQSHVVYPSDGESPGKEFPR
jgi:hypothetical protein